VGVDVVFHRYKKHFEEFRHMIKNKRSIWFPHSVNTDLFKPRGPKTRDVVMVGITSKHYPMRNHIARTLRDKPYFERIIRPPESLHMLDKWPIKEDYAEIVASAKICPTGGSIWHYPVAKYFEIPACNTLLMSDWFDELGDLGFIPNENMVVIDSSNLVKQVEWWLEHEDERLRVAENGYKLVLEKHTGAVRAKEFVKYLEECIESSISND
jgi:hypothetical protein